MKTYDVKITHKQMQIINELTGMVDADFAKDNDINLSDRKWSEISELYDLSEKLLNQSTTA